MNLCDVIVTIVILVIIPLKDVCSHYFVVLQQCLVSDICYLLLFTMVTIAFIIVYIYFKHIMRIVDHRWVRILNYVALYAGFTSAYGLIMVGSFQVTRIIMILNISNKLLQNKTKLSDLHYFGAVLAFGVGSFYCCVVTVISWHLVVINGQKMLLVVIRVLMCCCLIGGIISCKFIYGVTIAMVHVCNTPHCLLRYQACYLYYLPIIAQLLAIML